MERNSTQTTAKVGGNLVLPAWQTVVELRSRRGWTQEKLAEKSILSVRTIQNLESGRTTHLATISKVADALGVTAKDCITQSNRRQALASDAEIPVCPYKGLVAFGEADAAVFFGRESVIEILKDKVSHKNIVQLSGCSGSGKSSLVGAGLIPALRRSGSLEVIYCRPGADPFDALASALIPYLEAEADEVTRASRIPRLKDVLQQGQLYYLLEQVRVARNKNRLLLFIDQFEELYTHSKDHRLRDRFLDTLVPLTSAVSPVKLVFTLRADFSSRLFSHRRFLDQIQDSDVKIGAMTIQELGSVVRKPAELSHVTFEEGLVERILGDVGSEAAALPLLEFALTELWSGQRDRTITHAAYGMIGGLSGAITNRAERVYRSLTQTEQDAARQIFGRLVRLGDGGDDDTRQRISLAALYSEDLLNSTSKRKVLSVLADARLITVGIASSSRQQTVEIAHESLVKSWTRLRQWLQEDCEILTWRKRLHVIIQEWELTTRDDGYLLRGTLLDEARLWLSRRPDDLTPEEKDFISASLDLGDREQTRLSTATFEVLVENPGLDQREDRNADDGKIWSVMTEPGTVRLQFNLFPVPQEQRQSLASSLTTLPVGALSSLFSAARPAAQSDDEDVSFPPSLKSGEKLDDQTFAMLRDLQLRGASGLALELLNPLLDGIADPNVRLKFASIVFDMMHVRGRYSDAAELIRQEMAVHPASRAEDSRVLLPLKIRLLHHQMFYRPVRELRPQMLELLKHNGDAGDSECYGEILFMLGGNLGALGGNYREARRFLIKAIRHAKQRQDKYLLARCLRKYGDYLRYQGHLKSSRLVLMHALKLSARGRGTRQKIYILGCLGDLERQQQNYFAATENFERAIELANSTFIPGWLGNLYLGLSEIAIDNKSFDRARVCNAKAEGHYKNTQPGHLWGDIQVGLGRARILRAVGDSGWKECARSVRSDAVAAGYTRDAAFADQLLRGTPDGRNVLMFL